MINKDGLKKMLRDLRVLDFLKATIDIYINEDGSLHFANWHNQDGDCDELRIDNIPDYIKDDLYEWVMDDEI